MQEHEMIKLAKEAGFRAVMIPTSEIVVDSSFRKFCEDNLCGKYNANYSCPPDCGTVDEVRERLMTGKQALVLQTIWQIGSYDNKQGIIESKKAHNAAILRFTQKLRQAGIQGFCLGYGGCPLCDPCKRITNEPCAHPDQKISCMSAYCIDVAKLAEKCGLEFAWVPEKLFLFGMFVFV
jgi:predicted metal-binding protein